MQINQFDSKIISITQLRRDINILEEVLDDKSEAVVMRNQNILFVAVTPERYQSLKTDKKKKNNILEAVASINKIRQKYGKIKKGQPATNYLIKMRDERIKKWRQ